MQRNNKQNYISKEVKIIKLCKYTFCVCVLAAALLMLMNSTLNPSATGIIADMGIVAVVIGVITGLMYLLLDDTYEVE